MKYLIFLSCLIIGINCLATDEFLDLKSADGKTVRAKILSYDQGSDQVVIERENRKRYTVPATTFCESDQNKIRNWEIVEKFMSNSGLKVSVVRSKNDRIEVSEKTWMCDAYYTITLNNQSGLEFNNVKAEIIPFVQFVIFLPGKETDWKYKQPDKVNVFEMGKIEAKSKQEIKTKKHGFGHECLIVKEGSKVTRQQTKEFLGVWIRLTTELPDGTQVTRDIKEPEELWAGIEWSDAVQTIDLKTMKAHGNGIGDFLNHYNATE